MANNSELPLVTPVTLAAFEAQRGELVKKTVARAMARPQEVAQHGVEAEQLLTVGLDFTTQALAVAMRLRDGEMLDQQLRWGNDRLPHDGVSAVQVLHRLEDLAEVVSATLAEGDAAVVNAYVKRMIGQERALIADMQGTKL